MPEQQTGIYIAQTSSNLGQVCQIDNTILQFKNQTLDTPKLLVFFKLIQGAKTAMADCVILNKTNSKLYEANVQKKRNTMYWYPI